MSASSDIIDRTIIVENPPPSEKEGFTLIYKFENSGRKLKKINKKTKEKLTFIELIKLPGVNIIISSLTIGLIIIIYVLYYIFHNLL